MKSDLKGLNLGNVQKNRVAVFVMQGHHFIESEQGVEQKKRFQLGSTFAYHAMMKEEGGRRVGALISNKDGDYNNKGRDLCILVYFHHNLCTDKKTRKFDPPPYGKVHD